VSFGTGFGDTADFSSGDIFAIFTNVIFLPVGYVSNTAVPLPATLPLAGLALAVLGTVRLHRRIPAAKIAA